MKKFVVTIVSALLLASFVIPPAVMNAQARRRSIRGGARILTATQSAPAPVEVALLTQPEGNVQLKKRGQPKQAIKEDTLLSVGDAVSISGRGTAVIYQAYLPVKRLKADEQFDVVRRSPPSPAKALSPEEFTWFKVNYIAARRNRKNLSPAIQGGTQDASLTLLEPRNSVALVRRPTFNWSRVAEATKYVVNVYDKNESVVCTESTTETRLALPDKCTSLDPGDYKWEVTAQVGERVSDNPALYDATSFTVVPDQQASEISAALEHARTVATGGGADEQSVYVSALMGAKLYPQAEAELLRTLEQAPEDQALWTLLMETYAQMKRWRAREAAREISAGKPTRETIRAFALR